MNRYPKIGDIWQNKKHGTFYLVTGILKHHRTGEPMVAYLDKEGESFTRELDKVEDCWYNRFVFIEAPTYSRRTSSEGGE